MTIMTIMNTRKKTRNCFTDNYFRKRDIEKQSKKTFFISKPTCYPKIRMPYWIKQVPAINIISVGKS